MFISIEQYKSDIKEAYIKGYNKSQSIIIEQEYEIMLLERNLNKLQSNHTNEQEN